MAEKPTYEELEKRILELEQSESEHKRTEEVLRESEERYLQIFNIAPAGIYEVDFRTGKFIDVNAAVCEYSGYTKDELLSMNAIDVLTEESQEILLNRTGKVLSGESIPDTVDYEIIRQDGSLAWLSISNRYLYEGENIVGSTVVARDITERKRTEEELLKSEKKFKTPVNTAPYGIQLTDWKGKIIFSNPAHHAMHGYADGELIGKYIWDLIADDQSKTRTKNYYTNLIKNKPSPKDYYNKGITKDGRLIDVQINWDYVRNASGKVDGIISIVHDITERKWLEEGLRTSEKHLKSLLDSATGFAVYRLAYDEKSSYKLTVNFVSPSIKDILGVEQEDFTSETFFNHIHQEDLARVEEANQMAFETNRFDVICRYNNIQKNKWVWIHAISTGVRNAEGLVTHVNGIMIDITAKQEAEEKLKNKAQNLEEVNTALNVLLKKRENDKTNLEERFLDNITQMVLPYLDKIDSVNRDISLKVLIDILRENLSEVTSSLPHNLSSKCFNLSPTEIQVANFIKHGKNTKEIASILNISPKTVKNYRQKIREKIGIANKKINLQSRLSSLN